MKKGCLKVLQITDTHLFADTQSTLLGLNTEDSFNAVLETVLAEHQQPDVLLVTGDLSQDHTLEAYQRLAKYLQHFACPIYWIPGNHDSTMLEMTDILKNTALRADKSLLLSNWQFILLDSQVPGAVEGHLVDEELARLEQCLKKYPQRHTLICLHHHPVPVHCHWLDKLGLNNAQPFLKIVDQHPQVRVVLWGHIHQLFETERRKVKYLATPSTCVQFKPRSDEFALDMIAPGYRWLELYEDGSVQTRVCRAEHFTALPSMDSTGY